MTIISQSFGKTSYAALLLMLTIVLLALYEAGFDNNLFYWILLPLLVITILLVRYNLIRLDLSYKKPFFWYCLFLLWAGMSIFWSLNPHRTLVEFLQLALYGLIFLLATSLNESNIFRVSRIALIAGFLIALFGISQYMFLDSSRIESSLGNANIMGIFMVMLFLIGWGYYLRQPSRFFAIVCVTLLVVLVFTVSRGSYISLAFAFPLLLIGLDRSNIKAALVKSLLCVIAVLIISQLITLASPYLQELAGKDTALSNILTSRSAFVAWSGVSRFAFWETGLRVALNNPVCGTGLGTFFLAYFTEYVDNIWYARFVHNHYIQTAAELGFIGIILLLIFLFKLVQTAFLKIKSGTYPIIYPGLFAATIAFLIHIGGDFSWNFPAVAALFFFFSGALVATCNNSCPVIINSNLNKNVFISASVIIFALTAWQFTANIFYRQGVLMDAENNISEAAHIYDRANQIYPINSMAYSFASKTYFQMAIEQDDLKLLNEAIYRAERAVALSPVDGNLHNQLGRLYWQIGRYEEAEKHLTIATDYAAYRIGMFVDLAWYYIQEQRLNEASIIIKKGLSLKDYAEGMHPKDADRERVSAQIEALLHMQEIIEDNYNSGN